MDLEKIVESILFVNTKGLSLFGIKREIEKTFGIKVDRVEAIEDVIRRLNEKYERMGSCIRIFHRFGKYYMSILEDFQKYFIEKMIPELPESYIKVLSIVLNDYPVKQSEIVKVIGNRAYKYIEDLEKMGLINIKKVRNTKIIYPSSYLFKYLKIK